VKSKKIEQCDWKNVVFKMFHQGHESLNENELVALSKYYWKKIGTTLTTKKILTVSSNKQDIFDDLMAEMFLFYVKKIEEFKLLTKDQLWKKFNGHSRYYLEEKYYKKPLRKLKQNTIVKKEIKNEGKQKTSKQEQLYENKEFFEHIPPNLTNKKFDFRTFSDKKRFRREAERNPEFAQWIREFLERLKSCR